MKWLRVRNIFVAALCAATACAAAMRESATPAIQQPARQPAVTLVWPEPPAPARIRYLKALIPTTAGRKRSLLARFWNVLTGGREEAAMTQPYGLAMDTLDRLYVADTFGQAVHVFDLRNGRYSSIRVEGESLIGVAVLGDRLLVTDSTGGRLICLTLEGKRLWTLGREAGFDRPTGLAATGDRVYVVDTLAHRVVVVSATGAVLGRFGSHGGEPGQFNFPTNIAVGPDGRLYVTDSMNFRVQIFDPSGKFLSLFGHLGDGSGDFSRPKGIGIDSDGNIYVVEGLHDVVQIFDEKGQFLLAFGGSGTGDGEFWLPAGLAIHDDRIYVSDSSNRRVQVFDYRTERR